MDDYKSKLARVSDRDNHIFTSALIKRLNENYFINNLTLEHKISTIETLILNAKIFQQGSVQYHTHITLNHKYFNGFSDTQQIISLLEMIGASDQPSGLENNGNIFLNLVQSLISIEKDISSLIYTL
jgi:hypothetical protein